MRFSGYNVALIKVVVFAISCAMAGLAGALFVPQVGIISPANLGIVPSIEMVIWVAVGGRGTLVGAVVGAVLSDWRAATSVEEFPDIWLYFLGGLFVGVGGPVPDGIVGSLRKGWNGSSQGYPAPGRGCEVGLRRAPAGVVWYEALGW